MKRIKIAGLCLVAALALSASASAALPQYNLSKAKGKTTFTAKSKVSTLFLYGTGTGIAGSVVCKSAKDAGEITGAKTSTLTATFKGCTAANKSCHSTVPLGKKGEITTTLLEGTLGFKAGGQPKQEVAVNLRAAKAPFLAQFDCEGQEVNVSGSVDGQVTGDVNTFSKTSTQAFITNEGGENEINSFEGGTVGEATLLSELVGVATLPSGENATATVKNKGEVEIEAGAPAPPKWWVEGKLMSGTEALAETTKVDKPFSLLLTQKKGAVVIGSVECAVLNINTGLIEAPSGRTEKAEELSACTVRQPPPNESKESTKCEVVGGVLKSSPLKATLEGPIGAEKLKFEPQVAGQALEAFEIQNKGSETCSFAGKFRANGVMVCGYEKIEEEKVEHPLAFTGSSGSKVTLENPSDPSVGTNASEGLTVEYKVHLASGKTYSAF